MSGKSSTLYIYQKRITASVFSVSCWHFQDNNMMFTGCHGNADNSQMSSKNKIITRRTRGFRSDQKTSHETFHCRKTPQVSQTVINIVYNHLTELITWPTYGASVTWHQVVLFTSCGSIHFLFCLLTTGCQRCFSKSKLSVLTGSHSLLYISQKPHRWEGHVTRHHHIHHRYLIKNTQSYCWLTWFDVSGENFQQFWSFNASICRLLSY